jgi:hypothetical protein
MRYEEAKRREGLRFKAAYLRGWDSALIWPTGANNPYHRCDFRDWWEKGRRECLDNKPLPEWARNPSPTPPTGSDR